MNKVAKIFLYLTLLGFITTVIVNFLHLQWLGLLIFSCACFFLLTGCIISIFASSAFIKPGIAPRVANIYIISNTIWLLGFIFLAAGLYLQTVHFIGGFSLMFLGLLLSAIFLILLPYRISVKKKRNTNSF